MSDTSTCDVCGCQIALPEGDEFRVCEECFEKHFEDGTE